VLLRVDAAGLCHSDLHLMDWPAHVMPYELPFTLGHETAGTVAALGPGAHGVAEGERVVVYSRWGCGVCRACLAGAENRCPVAPTELGGHGGGVGRDGGLADYMLVPSVHYLVGIGDLDPAAAAPLTDAALTAYHAVSRIAADLRAAAPVLVIGAGGVGHMVIQVLRATTAARIVAVDLRDDALELACAAGADVVVPAAGLTPAQLRTELGGEGATAVLDCVASDATLVLAARTVAVGGHICYVGRGGGSLPVNPSLLPFECSVHLPSWGTRPELAEVVALARAGAIHAHVERIPLEDSVAAYQRLSEGAVAGRLVAIP
jgi:propanol-preferring alcohol dehydrogenase